MRPGPLPAAASGAIGVWLVILPDAIYDDRVAVLAGRCGDEFRLCFYAAPRHADVETVTACWRP